MKKIKIVILVCIICIQCEKPEGNSKYDNANFINNIDFTLISSSPLYESTKDSFNLDIDHDKIMDVTFFVSEYSLGRESTYFSKIKILNDYEIAIQKSYKYEANYSSQVNMWMVDSVLVDVPEICELSDTISDQLMYKSGLFDFAYNHYDSFQSYSWSTSISTWKNSGDKYIGLRNKSNNIYCWIKINILGISQISIISFKYTIDEDSFVIREE